MTFNTAVNHQLINNRFENVFFDHIDSMSLVSLIEIDGKSEQERWKALRCVRRVREIKIRFPENF